MNRLKEQRRRCKKKSSDDGTVTQEAIDGIFEKQFGKCNIC
jgi:hypothetical protein